MKLSERLQFYRDEVRRSKQWRQDEGYDDDWKRYIDLYRGKQYSSDSPNDQLMVNLIFSTINTIAPAVAINNPKFVVNARKPEQAPQATIVEEVLNYLWRQWRYQDEFRAAEQDNLVCGHGWCKVGYKFTKPPEEKSVEATEPSMGNAGGDVGIDDREDIEGNVESEMYVYDDRPFVERISVFDMFVDPDARHPKEMCWIAQRIWRPVQDVQVDDRYSPAARKKVSAKGWSRWSTGDGDARQGEEPNRGVKSFCEIVEFYDIKRRTMCTFALDSDDTGNESGFLIKPRPMPYGTGQPFEMLRNYEVADHFYPVGDVQQLEPLQLELNQTRTQMMNHRKRFQRKWLYERDAFDREAVAALEADVDNTMIPVMSDGNPANVIAPLPAVITPSEFYDQSAMISNDIDRVSGVTDYQRGATANTMKRTATEAAMIQDSANARAQDRLRAVEGTLARLGERLIALMQQYLTGEQVARIVTMPGGKAWVPYDADYLQGQFDFEVAAGSTEPMNETFRRQSAMQLVDASMPFLEMGVANPQGLYMYILQKGFGVKDTTSFIMAQPPPEEVDPATGQPQAVDPNAPPPPEQLQEGAPGGGGPMPPEGPMPPGGPPLMPPEGMPPEGMPPEGMPPEGMPPPDEIPPEILMALMNGGGPPAP